MTRITFIIIILISIIPFIIINFIIHFIMVSIIIVTTRAMTRANDWNQLLTIVALADSWLPYPIMPKPYHARSSVPSLSIPGLLYQVLPYQVFCTKPSHARHTQ